VGPDAVLASVMDATHEAGIESRGARSRRDQDRRQLARGSALNLFGSGIAAAVNLVMPILITRGLVQQDAGVFFQVTSLFTIMVSVGTLGADTGLLRFIPRSLALHRPGDLQAYYRVALGPALALSLALVGLLLALAGPISEAATGGSATAAPDFESGLRVLVPVLPLAVAYLIGLAASRGLGSVRPLVGIEKIGRGALQTVAVGVVLPLTGSLTLVVLAWVLPYLAASALLVWWLIKAGRRMLANASMVIEGRRGARPHELYRDFWAFSGPRALARVFAVALQRLDIILVGALRGPADAAVYAVATRFLVLGLMFVQAIQQVMAPRISEFLALHEDQRAREMYRTTTAWLTLISWPVYLLSACFAPVLLTLFGESYVRGQDAVVILCLAMLVATVCGPVDSVLLMGGRSVWSLLNTGSALAVTVALDLVLIPTMGVTGAAWAWAAGILVNNLLPLFQVHRFMGMHPFGAATRNAMTLTAITFGLVPLAVRIAWSPNAAALALAVGLGVTLFLIAAASRRNQLDLVGLTAALRRRKRDDDE